MTSVRVTIGTFGAAAEAEHARVRLQQAGIQSYVVADARVPVDAARRSALQVNALDAPEAEQVLGDMLENVGGVHLSHTPTLFEASEGPPLSECSRNARRACRAGIAGLVFVPIQFYATWLLLKVITSREQLDAEGRRSAWLAVAINVAGYVFGFSMYLYLFSPPGTRSTPCYTPVRRNLRASGFRWMEAPN